VWKGFFYLLRIKNRWLVGIINRYILQILILFDILFYFLRKFNIGAVSGAICYYSCLNGISYESQITDNIQRVESGRSPLWVVPELRGPAG